MITRQKCVITNQNRSEDYWPILWRVNNQGLPVTVPRPITLQIMSYYVPCVKTHSFLITLSALRCQRDCTVWTNNVA